MKLDYVNEVVFDGSTRPGTVLLNDSFVLRFDTDEDAKRVFEILYKQRDASIGFRKRLDEWKTRFNQLPELLP